MPYSILYKASVRQDLKRLDKTEARRILKAIEHDLPLKADTAPPLKGAFAGLRKYRIGDWRVIFVIIEEDVMILRIAHRKEAYRNPPKS